MIRSPRTWLLIVLCIGLVAPVVSQQSTILRRYETNVYNNYLAKQGLHRNENIAEINRRLKYKEKRKKWDMLTLPLVFHIVYREGTLPHSEAVVWEQIEALNADFGAESVPGKGVDPRDPDGTFRQSSVESNIRFCYPSKVKTKQRKGQLVNYFALTLADTVDIFMLREDGGIAPPFNPRKYINIWVVPDDMIHTGFAQYPGGNKDTDGIVISHSFFGIGAHNHPGYGGGKTLTHLMGNYLGLRPIWGDESCSDDGIRDTPAHNAPNLGKPRPYHTSTCNPGELEMTMNYMDSSDDAYLYMFTRRQVRYMRANLTGNGFRKKLANTDTYCSDRNANGLPTIQQASSKAPVAQLDLTVSPNPASKQLTVSWSVGSTAEEVLAAYELQVFSAAGRKQYSEKFSAAEVRRPIDVSDWPRGVYVVTVTASATEVLQQTVRFVLQ